MFIIRVDVPIYASILNILSTEFYWFGREVHPNLNDCMKKFLGEDDEYLRKWSLVSFKLFFTILKYCLNDVILFLIMSFDTFLVLQVDI